MVFLDKSTEAVYSLYAAKALEPVLGRVGDRHLEVDPAVRAFVVIVLDELAEHAVEVALAPYEHPVQALGPGCAHKALGERVRAGRPHGCLDNPGVDRPHHLVEGPDELGVTVTDEEPDGSALVLQGDGQVTGLLGDPGPDRVGGHAGQEDLAPLEVDEEQHIEPPERDGVDVEEVACEGAVPAWARRNSDHRRPRCPRRRSKAVTAKHVAHARRRNGHTELPALPDDAEVAPAGVLPGQAKYEGDDLVVQGIACVAGRAEGRSKTERRAPGASAAAWPA